MGGTGQLKVQQTENKDLGGLGKKCGRILAGLCPGDGFWCYSTIQYVRKKSSNLPSNQMKSDGKILEMKRWL